MPFYSDYRCTKCKKKCTADTLFRKKVDFLTMGGTGRRTRTIRSRTQAWLCTDCMEQDPAYNIEAHNTPGMQSPALNRVRAAQEARENGSGAGTAGDRTQASEVPAECPPPG